MDSIVSIDGEMVYKTPVNVLSELPDKNDSYRIVEEGMLMASTEGSASRFLDGLPFGVASKTGTAQVANGYYNATMMAYGPVDNPEIAIGIIAEKSGNGYMLAESVRDVFLKYYELKDVRQSENWREILAQRELEAQQAAENPEHTEGTVPQQNVQQPVQQ